MNDITPRVLNEPDAPPQRRTILRTPSTNDNFSATAQTPIASVIPITNFSPPRLSQNMQRRLERQRDTERYYNFHNHVRNPNYRRDIFYVIKPRYNKWRILSWDQGRQEYIIKNQSLGCTMTIPFRYITAYE